MDLNFLLFEGSITLLERLQVTHISQTLEYGVKEAIRTLCHSLSTEESRREEEVLCRVGERCLQSGLGIRVFGFVFCYAMCAEEPIVPAEKILRCFIRCFTSVSQSIDRRKLLALVTLINSTFDALRALKSMIVVCSAIPILEIVEIASHCVENDPKGVPNLLEFSFNRLVTSSYLLIAEEILLNKNEGKIVPLDFLPRYFSGLSLWLNAIKQRFAWIQFSPQNGVARDLLPLTLKELDSVISRAIRSSQEIQCALLNRRSTFAALQNEEQRVVWADVQRASAVVRLVSHATDMHYNSFPSLCRRDLLEFVAQRCTSIPQTEDKETSSHVFAATLELVVCNIRISTLAPSVGVLEQVWNSSPETTSAIVQLLLTRGLHFKNESVQRLSSALLNSIVKTPSSKSATVLEVSQLDELVELLSKRDAASLCVIQLVANAARQRPLQLVPTLFRLCQKNFATSPERASVRRNVIEVLSYLANEDVSHLSENEVKKTKEVFARMSDQLLLALDDEELSTRLITSKLFAVVPMERVCIPLLRMLFQRGNTNFRGIVISALKAVCTAQPSVVISEIVQATSTILNFSCDSRSCKAPENPSDMINAALLLHRTPQEGENIDEKRDIDLVLNFTKMWISESEPNVLDRIAATIIEACGNFLQQPPLLQLSIKIAVIIGSFLTTKDSFNFVLTKIISVFEEAIAQSSFSPLPLVVPLLIANSMPRSSFEKVSTSETLLSLNRLLLAFIFWENIGPEFRDVQKLAAELVAGKNQISLFSIRFTLQSGEVKSLREILLESTPESPKTRIALFLYCVALRSFMSQRLLSQCDDLVIAVAEHVCFVLQATQKADSFVSTNFPALLDASAISFVVGVMLEHSTSEIMTKLLLSLAGKHPQIFLSIFSCIGTIGNDPLLQFVRRPLLQRYLRTVVEESNRLTRLNLFDAATMIAAVPFNLIVRWKDQNAAGSEQGDRSVVPAEDCEALFDFGLGCTRFEKHPPIQGEGIKLLGILLVSETATLEKRPELVRRIIGSLDKINPTHPMKSVAVDLVASLVGDKQ